MKISFICGSLAPGKDGVGDYTRRLAEELRRKGHECQLISINDGKSEPTQIDNSVEIVRFQAALHGDQSQAVEAAIAQFNPDWISLQFVCFAFHPKGFTHKLTALISNLRIGRRLDIMFHELWVGEQPSLPFKHKVMGRIQQWLIVSALKQWTPDSIHTSNRLYQHILKRHGYSSERLPIFGNIPVAPAPASADFARAKNERIVLFPFSQRKDWNVDETLSRLKEIASAAKVSLQLIQIGSLRAGLHHWDAIEAFAHDQGWQCQRLGSQPEETLSQWMQAADVGISSAHIHLVDKSGAAVAMHEHGLPVICTITDPVSNRFTEIPKPIDGLSSFFDSEERLISLFNNPPKRPPASRLTMVATKWLEHLADKASS